MLPNIYLSSKKTFFKAVFSVSKFSTRARQPLIKFLGTRQPQPKFDPSATSSTATAATSYDKVKSAISSAKPAIEFTEVPAKFRRKLISEEEIQIINSGGFRN